MTRKVSKADLEALGMRTGVRVRYPEKQKPPPQEAAKPQEIVLTLPKGLLEPLVKALAITLDLHEKTHSDISKALEGISTNNAGFACHITKRDEKGRIKDFTIDKT